MNQQCRKLWTVAITEIRKNRTRFRRLDAEAFSATEVVLLCDYTASNKYNLPLGEATSLPNRSDVEIVRLQDIDASQLFKKAEALAISGIDVGDDMQGLWEERFSRYARYSKEIVILDKFPNYDGLNTLLNFIDQDAAIGPYTGCEVLIYTRVPPYDENKKNEEDELRLIKDNITVILYSLTGMGIHRLKVRTFLDDDFTTLAHGRHIRFDKNVCRIDIGVTELFRYSDAVRKYSDFSAIVLPDSGKAGEKDKKEANLDNTKRYLAEFVFERESSNQDWKVSELYPLWE